MKKNLNILLISAFKAPYIQDDIDSLRKYFSLDVQIGRGIINIIKIFFKVFRANIIFCWFASVYASLGVIFGKVFGVKSIIVVGGVDVAKIPQLNYGIWLNPFKAILVGYALRTADKVCVVDPSLAEDAKRQAKYDGKNIIYIPTGFDSSFWKPLGEKESIVLSIALVSDETRYRIKGIDILVETARMLPDQKFVIIGVKSTLWALKKTPNNITFLEPIERINLLPFYRRAKVYCQPSLREGLPSTLCEAMLCGCIPVATRVGGNPTAVDNIGIIVPPNDSYALANAIKEAMQMPEEIGFLARSRIISLFPKEKRENSLVRIINNLH